MRQEIEAIKAELARLIKVEQEFAEQARAAATAAMNDSLQRSGELCDRDAGLVLQDISMQWQMNGRQYLDVIDRINQLPEGSLTEADQQYIDAAWAKVDELEHLTRGSGPVLELEYACSDYDEVW